MVPPHRRRTSTGRRGRRATVRTPAWARTAMRSPLGCRMTATLTARAGTVAVILQPSGERIAVRALVRVVTQREALREAVAELTAVARRAGARLQRVDGEHGLGVYATAPTAGGLL